MKWLDTEKQKLHGLTGKKKLEYIWDYYKLWLIGLAALLLFGIYVGNHMLSAAKETRIYVAFVNTYAELGEHTPFWDGYVAATQTDTGQENVIFDSNNFFDTTRGSVTGNHYFEKIAVLIDAEALDAIVMERDNLTQFAAGGRLMDLTDERTAQIAEKYPDRILTTTIADADGGEREVPVGIDISDSILVTQEQAYADDCALGISQNVQHMDAVMDFLDYVLRE